MSTLHRFRSFSELLAQVDRTEPSLHHFRSFPNEGAWGSEKTDRIAVFEPRVEAIPGKNTITERELTNGSGLNWDTIEENSGEWKIGSCQKLAISSVEWR
jgi:hypothetical protein